MRQNMPVQPSIWLDSCNRYGLVSRILHWSMAYVLIWQFLMIFSWKLFGEMKIMETVSAFGPGHGTAGFLTILLFSLRIIWAFINRHRRPAHAAGWMGWIALCVHKAFYALFFIIPAVALLRSYGSGKGYKQWGIEFVPATGQKVEWMMAPANAMHSLLAWVLCALVTLHILAALFHHLILRDGTLTRMTGSVRKLLKKPTPNQTLAPE